MSAVPVTDPLAGRRIFVTDWPKHPTAAAPPTAVRVLDAESVAVDLGELVDTLGSLTASECEGLRNAIFADANSRARATLADLNGTAWNKWCYLTGLRYGPAFAAEGVFTAADREQLIAVFVDRAASSGWMCFSGACPGAWSESWRSLEST